MKINISVNGDVLSFFIRQAMEDDTTINKSIEEYLDSIIARVELG